jgi:hypothetical protein
MKAVAAFAAIIVLSAESYLASAQDSLSRSSPGMSTAAAMLQARRTFIYLDFTENTWVSRPDGITTRFISGGFNANLFYEIFLVRNVFTFAPGISYSNVTVKNNADVTYEPRDGDPRGYTALVPIEGGRDYRISKISTSYFDIPLEFHLRIKPEQRGRNLWLSPGFRMGWMIGNFWKYDGDNAGGDNVKFKSYRIENFEKFHYGVSLRAGYYKFGGYMYYSLVDLFKQDAGTPLRPFSVGLSLTPF